jgi:peptidoglycan-N-acetylglucosamine deacetylase
MNPWEIVVPAVAVGAAGITAWGAVDPRSQLLGQTICGTTAARKLAITFDDGPNPKITPKLLELLAQHNAKATFFVVGKFVRECPGLVKEIVGSGHLLGNHTETHPNLFFRGMRETRDELERCSEAIAEVTLERPRWFRPPFGFRSPWLGEVVHQQGMRTVMWSLIPGDWRVKPEEWLMERIKPIATRAQENGVGKKTKEGAAKAAVGGDLICLHDGDYRELNGDRGHTLKALEYWLPRWRDIGLEFVTIGDGAGR